MEDKKVTGIYYKDENVVRGNASCFIIPNSAGVCNDFLCSPDEYTEDMRAYCKLNGLDIDPANTKLIQVWWHSEEFGTDNMYRHGCYAVDCDGTEYRWGINTPEYMTYDMIKDCKEGDVISIKVPIWIGTVDEYRKGNKTIDGTAELQLKLNQLNYRYGNHGRFEEVLRKVL